MVTGRALIQRRHGPARLARAVGAPGHGKLQHGFGLANAPGQARRHRAVPCAHTPNRAGAKGQNPASPAARLDLPRALRVDHDEGLAGRSSQPSAIKFPKNKKKKKPKKH